MRYIPTQITFALLGIVVATLAREGNAMSEAEYSVEPWRHVLERYQHQGGLDYKALLEDRDELDRFLDSLADARPDTWSSADQIAFWCNAYNAVVAYYVLARYPEIPSVKEVAGFFNELRFPVAGREMTLDEIESAARELGDPRVHFAVVCASTGCPDLQPSPFEGPKLEEQFQAATEEFLRDSSKGMRFEPGEGTVYLSSIFKWYAGDFTGGSTAVAFLARGKVLDWVLEQLSEDRAELIRDADPKVRYLDYDWSLNDRPR